MAHLVNFQGSDTVEGILAAQEYYCAKMPGSSIPAMEHSTVMSWGGAGSESIAFSNMLRRHRGFKMVACVSDTYNIFDAVRNLWCDYLLDEVKRSGMTVVIRPDSGDAVGVNLEILRIMGEKLGTEVTTNDRGFRVLPAYYRLIQGDGNNSEADIDRVLTALEDAGWSSDNIAFGMGGGLLQQVNRDTQRFAYKISEIEEDGLRMAVAKNPASDPSKRSKAGRVMLWWDGQTYETKPVFGTTEEAIKGRYEGGKADAMNTVWENGHLVYPHAFRNIRQRAARGL